MKNPLVVGYRGEIGKYILRGLIDFLPSAIPIKCIDIHDTNEDVEERIKVSDVIFLCVPLNKTAEWLYKWQIELRGKTVIEQTSLKAVVFNNEKYKFSWIDINLRSMHILFRPSITDNPEDRTIVMLGDKEFWCTLDLTYFFNKGLDINHFSYIQTWKEHDAEMALQQALAHRAILVLSKLVSQYGHHEYNTYISRQIIRLAQRIQDGDVELYQAIQENPNLEGIMDKFINDIKMFDLKKVYEER